MNGDIDEYDLGTQDLISYIRMTEDERVLVVINLTGRRANQEIAADPELW